MVDDPIPRLNAALEGRYCVERRLGEGGMATVYLAEDVKHRREVAVKVLEAEVESDSARKRFEREIETIARLRHPHILPLHDSGQTDGLMYFVMPFVEGGTLRDRIREEGPLPLVAALRIAKQISQAIAHAHEHGIVHRDIKPANVMMDSGHAVVSDFGIALLAGSSLDRITATGGSPGTPAYMSPEQLDDDGTVDSRSDIYALGCVLYEMLAGEPPYTGSTVRAVVSRKLVDPVPPLRTVRDNVPDAVERLTLKTLARLPADRPRSAAEVADRLAQLESEATARETDADGLRMESDLIRSPAQLTSLVVSVTAGAALLLTAIGMLSTRVFDQKIQMPPMYTPSRSDYLFVGAQALVPFFVWGFLGLAFWFFLARYVVPVTTGGISLVTQAALRNRSPSLRAASRLFRQPWSSASLADLFLGGVIVTSVAVIALPPIGEVYYALLSATSGALGCEERTLHRLQAIGLPALIVGFGLARHSLFRRLRGRSTRRGGWTLARWASAAWLVVLVVVAALPWRVLWDSEYPRALIGAERAYVIVEETQRVLAYTPSTGSVRSFDRADTDIDELGVIGYLFEEPEVFESSVPGCALITQSSTS